LVLPGFAFLEPYQTLVRRENEGKQLRQQLSSRAKQLERTSSIAADVPGLHRSIELLVRAEQEASKRFRDTRASLLTVARIVPIDLPTLTSASAFADQLGLELPDALVLAAVLADATERRGSSLFLNRNTKDFGDPDIAVRLESVDCELIGRFDDGLSRVNRELARA
jgi:predicted nucleic acid-binding protein